MFQAIVEYRPEKETYELVGFKKVNNLTYGVTNYKLVGSVTGVFEPATGPGRLFPRRSEHHVFTVNKVLLELFDKYGVALHLPDMLLCNPAKEGPFFWGFVQLSTMTVQKEVSRSVYLLAQKWCEANMPVSVEVDAEEMQQFAAIWANHFDSAINAADNPEEALLLDTYLHTAVMSRPPEGNSVGWTIARAKAERKGWKIYATPSIAANFI